jgi:hypothetical protein
VRRIWCIRNHFAVDIIEPKILLTKEVKDEAGNDASGANVM